MPVQVPLQRFDSSAEAPQPIAPISTDVADESKATAAIGDAVASTGEAAIKYGEQIQAQKVNLDATAAASQYQIKYRTWMANQKANDGDPTQAFSVELPQLKQQWQNEVLSDPKYANGTDQLKQTISSKFQKVNFELDDNASVQQAIQHAAYQKNVFNGGVALEQQGTLDAASVANADEPTSFAQMQVHLNNIKDLRMQEGVTNGLVTLKDPSKPATPDNIANVDSSLKMQMLSDTSHALKNVVTTLANSGHPEEAQYIMDNYKPDMLASDQTALTKSTKESFVTQKATAEVAATRGMPPDEQMKKLQTIEDAEVSDAAMKIAASEQAHIHASKTFAADDQFDIMSKAINDRKQPGSQSSPFLTLNDLHNDPTYKNALPRLTPKQIDNLDEQVVAPKFSDPDAKAAAYEALIKGDFSGMKYGNFQNMMGGLSQKDRGQFETEWRNQNAQTPSSQKAMVSYMGTQLKNEMIASGAITINSFGRLSNDDQSKLIQANDFMLQQTKAFPPGTSPVEQNKWVKDHVGQIIKQEAFTNAAAPAPKLQSAPPPDAAPSVKDQKNNPPPTSTDTAAYWGNQFYKVNKRPFNPALDHISAFIEAHPELKAGAPK